jgi:hypothetical protein
MKAFTSILRAILFSSCFFIALPLFAQQQQAPPSPPSPASHQAPAEPAAPAAATSAYKDATITYNIIDAANGTFGYDVFVNGKLTIHQTSIPALPGNDGFKTKDDATKVAELVMYKIRKGEMPPTVSPEEMKDLGVK